VRGARAHKVLQMEGRSLEHALGVRSQLPKLRLLRARSRTFATEVSGFDAVEIEVAHLAKFGNQTLVCGNTLIVTNIVENNDN